MGVDLFLLDRRKVTLSVGGIQARIGTLRYFCKSTCVDEGRAALLDAAEASVNPKTAPRAVMLEEGDEARSTETYRPVTSHLVLGWDADRAYISDWEWDYLPVLGYAVRHPDSNKYTLCEKRGGMLHPIDFAKGEELGILSPDGRLVRRGQPVITECRSVQPYIKLYAEADCTLSDGRKVELFTPIQTVELPDASWYVGKRPIDVKRYPVSAQKVPEPLG
jgi:hypothetical protein